MSGSTVCRCPMSAVPWDQRRWVVVARNCNHSAFNGWRKTPSAYSEVECQLCGARWRTRANYVIALKDK